MKDKVFVLCLGMPRAGTTWLYNQLKKYSGFCAPINKEMHVWETIDLGYTHYKSSIQEAIRLSGSIRSQPLKKLLQIFGQPNLYFDYYSDLITNANGKHMTGDFTPNYWDLSTTRLEMIKQNLVKKGFKIKIIFIMREPFSRLISQCITNLRVKKLESYRWESRISSHDFGNPSTEEIKATVFESYTLPRERSPYSEINYKLDNVFDKDEIFKTFYEELFENKTINRLSKFLRISNTLFDTTEVVNASGIKVNFNQDEINLVTSHYKQCYDYVYNTSPYIKTKWQESTMKYLINTSTLKTKQGVKQ